MAHTMWMLQNSKWKMFLASEDDARFIRRTSKLFKDARIKNILQMKPDDVHYGEAYPR